MNRTPGISAFALKVAAIVGMTFNHVANVFGTVLPDGVAVATYAVGGLTFPIMGYLLCEGYRHTSNVGRYAQRLAVFAVISQVPFSLLFGATGNVLFTLLIGLGLLWAQDHLVESAKENSRESTAGHLMYWLLVVAGIAVSALCDWGVIGPLMILLFWRMHDRPHGVAAVMLVPIVGLGLPALSWAMTEPTALSLGAVGYYFVGCGAATLLMLNYNGQRGRPMKWFFYAYYPAHLFVLWALTFAM